MLTIEKKIARSEHFAKLCGQAEIPEWQEECEQLVAWLRELQERRKVPEIVRCGECKHKGTKNCVANTWATIFGFEVKDDFYCGLAERRTDAVKALPSAQPEIVRCKDCIYYNWDCVDVPYGLTKMTCWCDLHYDAVNENLMVNPDDYCKWAKRRSDE